MFESLKEFSESSAVALDGFQNEVLQQVETIVECQSASNTVAALAKQFHSAFVNLNGGSALIDDPIKFMSVMMIQVGSTTIQKWLSDKAMELEQKSELTSTEQSGIETDENIIHQEP